jgi:hypothetical protein
MRPVRLTWTIGGIALIVAGVVGMLGNTTPAWTSLALMIEVVWAAAVLLFAIGLSREASVVARRPLGLGALVVLALWPLTVRVIDAVLPASSSAMLVDPLRMGLTYTSLLIMLAAALLASVQIARSDVLPRPWRWAPLWALGVDVIGGALPYLIFMLASPAQSTDLLALVNIVAQLGFLARTLGLGILAVVLAARLRPGSVDVLRSGPE